MSRTLGELLRGETPDDGAVGDSGVGGLLVRGTSPASGFSPPPGSEPLGYRTGAPTRTEVRTLQILPGTRPTQFVFQTRENRIVTMTAPFVGFTIFVGDSGVKVGDFALPVGLPYDLSIVGYQELYAVTDAPVLLPLRLVIAPILMGDRERRY